LITLGQFFWKLKKYPKCFGYFFLRWKLCINFHKNGLCYILDDFFSQTHLWSSWSTCPKINPNGPHV
jgi:hypothetical protein